MFDERIFSVASVVCRLLQMVYGTDTPGGVLLLPIYASVSPLVSAESTAHTLHIFLIFIALCELSFLNLCASIAAVFA